MAAEITVNRIKKSSDIHGSSTTHGRKVLISSAVADCSSPVEVHSSPDRQAPRTPPPLAYDTRDEDGQNLNSNQRKPYNKAHEFFTKPLGPGSYDASVELTKKKT